jgi:hypothetical protein
VAGKVRALEEEHAAAVSAARDAERRLAAAEHERARGGEALSQLSSLQLAQYRQRRELLKDILERTDVGTDAGTDAAEGDIMATPASVE